MDYIIPFRKQLDSYFDQELDELSSAARDFRMESRELVAKSVLRLCAKLQETHRVFQALRLKALPALSGSGETVVRELSLRGGDIGVEAVAAERAMVKLSETV